MPDSEKLTSVPLSHALGDGTVGQLPCQVDHGRDTAGTVDLKALAFKVLQRFSVGQARDSAGTKPVQNCPTPKSMVGQSQWTADDWRAFYDERAGIREFEGALPRHEAERLALEETAQHWRALHPMPSSSFERGCVQCGGTDDHLVPHLARDKGHFWLHTACWTAFDQARRSEALAAVKALISEPQS